MAAVKEYRAFIPIERTLGSLAYDAMRNHATDVTQAVKSAILARDFSTAYEVLPNIDFQHAEYAIKRRAIPYFKGAYLLGASFVHRGLRNLPKDAIDRFPDYALNSIASTHADIVSTRLEILMRASLVKIIRSHQYDFKEAGYVKKDDADLVDQLNKAVDGNAKMMASMSANLSTSRLAAYGFLAEADVEGVGQYQLQAVMDGRTSIICQELDGRTFDVRISLGYLDSILQATDPESLRAMAPFINAGAVDEEDIPDMSDDELQAQGVMVPPFHSNCRTTLVRVGDVEVDESTLPDLSDLEDSADDSTIGNMPTMDDLFSPAAADELGLTSTDLSGGDLFDDAIAAPTDAAWMADAPAVIGGDETTTEFSDGTVIVDGIVEVQGDQAVVQDGEFKGWRSAIAKRQVQKGGVGSGIKGHITVHEAAGAAHPTRAYVADDDAGRALTKELTKELNVGEDKIPTKALENYTETGNYSMNAILRHPDPAAADNYPFLYAQAHALADFVTNDTNTLKDDLTVWRGTRISVPPDKIVGAVITDNGIVSTSLRKNTAQDFAIESSREGKVGRYSYLMQLEVPAGTHAYLVRGGEKEVLLPPGTSFRVDSVSDGSEVSGTIPFYVLSGHLVHGQAVAKASRSAGKGSPNRFGFTDDDVVIQLAPENHGLIRLKGDGLFEWVGVVQKGGVGSGIKGHITVHDDARKGSTIKTLPFFKETPKWMVGYDSAAGKPVWFEKAKYHLQVVDGKLVVSKLLPAPKVPTLPNEVEGYGEKQTSAQADPWGPWDKALAALPADISGLGLVQLNGQNSGVNRSYLFDYDGKKFFAKETVRYGDKDNEILAMKIGRVLGLNVLPVVERGKYMVTPAVSGTPWMGNYNKAASVVGKMSDAEKTREVIGQYLLGDPDRHAGNFMLDTQAGKIYDIDWGGAFKYIQHPWGTNELISVVMQKSASKMDKGVLLDIAGRKEQLLGMLDVNPGMGHALLQMQKRFAIVDTLAKMEKPTFGSFKDLALDL